MSTLIGRHAQLVKLEQLLERHRAVTLTGPAGAGKTRLAIEVAARIRRPVCYVDFSPIEDPGLVAPTVAAAMCEAVEDLARDEVADRPEVAATLLRAARAERDRRALPLRQRDAQELADLERALAAGSQLTLRPFNDLVAELAE